MDVEQYEALRGFNVTSAEAISKIIERQLCIKCKKKRMYFCYDCRKYIPSVENLVPKVKLPVKVDIIKHQLERNGKSTATHCLLLAPDATRIFDKFDEVPNYAAELLESDSYIKTVVVYPSENALSIDEYVKQNGPIQRFVFLDATWWTVKRLRNLSQLKGVPNVGLMSYKTLYWRSQKGFSDEFLATIEAIYYAIRENFEASKLYCHNSVGTIEKLNMLIEKVSINAESGQFDNLLFWFFFFRSMVKPDKRKKN